ncbi:SCO3242 family prenyltransferase [Streptomyces sp. N35]|uniref:SCO3242 family prenyltransferase n=1 Tax=Streptomyces sp. N35 TaxID=2795730 RepID=UPI001F3AF0FB|nr:UbiA family prenyltransferase [Streptomyces sp. N35]
MPRPEALPGEDSPSHHRPGLGDWAELLRVSALFTVPGDALAGAAASGARPRGRTLLAIASSLCLYEAGMALNDWADREVDAVERPHRPLPSGRITPFAPLAAATGLTAAGLALASLAGRRPLAVAGALAGTVWAYDLGLKNTPAGPLAMAGARSLDLLLGAVATTGRVRPALPASALLGAHTFSVTTVSRREAEGGSTLAPLAGLAVTAVLARAVAHGRVAHGSPVPGPTPASHQLPVGPTPASHQLPAGRGVAAALGLPGPTPPPRLRSPPGALDALPAAQAPLPAAQLLSHALLTPSPQLTQRAVGGGIRAMIPLQAALAARSGHPGVAVVTASLAPLARRFARKVSVT